MSIDSSKSVNKTKLILIIPAFWASLFDITITVSHQAKEYWKGNLKMANEGNPIGSLFMSYHVSGIFIISFLWLCLIVILGYYLSQKTARVFLLFVLLAHSWGGSTWIVIHFGFWFVMLFLIVNAILFYTVQDFTRNEIQKPD